MRRYRYWLNLCIYEILKYSFNRKCFLVPYWTTLLPKQQKLSDDFKSLTTQSAINLLQCEWERCLSKTQRSESHEAQFAQFLRASDEYSDPAKVNSNEHKMFTTCHDDDTVIAHIKTASRTVPLSVTRNIMRSSEPSVNKIVISSWSVDHMFGAICSTSKYLLWCWPGEDVLHWTEVIFSPFYSSYWHCSPLLFSPHECLLKDQTQSLIAVPSRCLWCWSWKRDIKMKIISHRVPSRHLSLFFPGCFTTP